MHSTASLHHIFESEIFGFYLWATYFDVNSLQFAKLLPSSDNRKLSLIVINKEPVLDQPASDLLNAALQQSINQSINNLYLYTISI